ncbi:MAG: hypothetical protein DCC55_36630 [Chloroflexi bacterium]|nr:MAG: hypothetical protein DCC55_36630 [Chloroflexota bacterium]
MNKRKKLCASISLVASMGMGLIACQLPSQSTGLPSSGGHPSQSNVSYALPPDPIGVALNNGPFSGITILDSDRAAGTRAGDSLVIFVSSQGTYASTSLGDCLSWVMSPSADVNILKFGVDDPETIQMYKNAGVKICDPFTVQHESNGSIRVSVGAYSRIRKVLARIPLREPAWDHPILKQHAVKGVQLGPVQAGVLKASPFNKASLNEGVFAGFKVDDPDGVSPGGYVRPISGFASAREITGLPSDTLITAWHDAVLAQRGPGAALTSAVRQKYGAPSFVTDGMAFWVYDMDGKLLREKDAAPTNCFGNYEQWIRQARTNGMMHWNDVGPWGCLLIMRHSYPEDNAVINSYQVGTYSGLGAAWPHFQGRLLEVRAAKDTIAKLNQFKPKL